EVSGKTHLRVSFSVTTDREDVRRVFEPHCAGIGERWETIRILREAGIPVTATLAPILPCDTDALLDRAMLATFGPVVGDPLHVREVKRTGATTREPAHAICRKHGWGEWLEPDFQREVLERMRLRADSAGREFVWGPAGFGRLLTPGT
ncbi:MAG TPA: radical SAM protein, partial [Bryobacteraceae bacterium]|nr:radical SAM protein [Bryobacteraceae bacterium]